MEWKRLMFILFFCRFETEIASQPSAISVPVASYQYSQPSAYSMPYVPGSQFASPSLMGTNQCEFFFYRLITHYLISWY